MNIFDKDVIIDKYDKESELIEYISDIRNIHIERIKITEKNKDNKIEIIKKALTPMEFIIIIHNDNIVFFDNNKDLLNFQDEVSLKFYIIFEDSIKCDIKPNIYKKTNSIIILNDENIMSSDFCDEIRSIIDDKISKKQHSVEKWDKSQNVNCLYFSSSTVKDIDDSYKNLDKRVYETINRLVKKFALDYGRNSSGDSGYCYRKIFGPTRIHSDGLTANAIGDVIPINNVRNMSIIIALNDDYEGGEIFFPKQDYKVKLKKGDIICFPPYDTHPHMVAAPLNRTYRYTINTWLYQ